MKSRGRWIAVAPLLLIVVTALWVAGGTAQRSTRPARPPEYLRASIVTRLPASRALRGVTVLNWAHGSWCWFGDPRVVHVSGKRDQTLIGWIGWHGQITIGAYDGRSRLTGSHVIGRLAVD